MSAPSNMIPSPISQAFCHLLRGEWRSGRVVPEIPLKHVEGPAYILQESDCGIEVHRDNASANTTEIPLNATVPLLIGFMSIISQAGDGPTSIFAEEGVKLKSTELKLSGKGMGLFVVKVGPDEWDVLGGVA